MGERYCSEVYWQGTRGGVPPHIRRLSNPVFVARLSEVSEEVFGALQECGVFRGLAGEREAGLLLLHALLQMGASTAFAAGHTVPLVADYLRHMADVIERGGAALDEM